MNQPPYSNPEQPYGNPEQPPQYAPPPPQQPYGAPQPGYAPPPPGYSGQPVYAAAPASSSAGSKWGPTSIGLESHIAAGLSYIWIVGLIFFFIEKSNRFVRFHAAQSILLGIAGIILAFVDIAVSIILGILAAGNAGALFGGLSLLFSCVFGLAYLGLFGLFVWGLISGFTGRYTKFPIIGDIAERWAGGPPMQVAP